MITSNTNSMEMVGAATGGLLGMLIGRFIDSSAKKKKTNEAQINISSSQATRVVCKAGAFDAVIHEVKNDSNNY